MKKLLLLLALGGGLEVSARVEAPLGIQGIQAPEETSFAKKLPLRLPRDFANKATSFGDLSFNYLNVFFDFYGLKSFCVCGTFLSCAPSTIISANGATDTVFLNYSAPNLRVKINDGVYTDITWPCTVQNTNPGGPTLKVLFENDATLSVANSYFICGSSNIQFGSTALKTDGTRPVVTVDGLVNYPGLIQNGAVGVNGYANIHVYNLQVTLINGSTLDMFGGWVGQAYFGRGATDVYFVNCSSDGDIGSSSGGIVGRDAGGDGGKVTIIGCYSSGSIDSDAGGIAGYQAGYQGETIIQYSWSSGDIVGLQAGGIFGNAAGWAGSATAENCFSTGGILGIDAGGVFGKFAGAGAQANAINSYSRGNISGLNAGGIFGARAAEFGGSTAANNCYSAGNVAGLNADGIYGDAEGGGASQANTYVANGTWSSVAANAALTGIPIASPVGVTWANTALNQPYDLSTFGYTPYSRTNISVVGGVPSLVQSHSQTVTAGASSSAAIISGLNYTILQKSRAGVVGAYPTITINSTTGVIVTTSRTQPGAYTLVIDNEVPGVTSGYGLTEVVLTVKQNSRGRPKKSW